MLSFHDPNDQDTAAMPPEPQRRPAACRMAQVLTGPKPPPGQNATATQGNNQANPICALQGMPPNVHMGDFTIACGHYPASNHGDEAICMAHINTALFDAAPLSFQEHTNLITSQAPPFPLLAVNSRTNLAVVLHAITVYQPQLGMPSWHHPAMGKTIAMLGNTPQAEMLPMVITIPATTFHQATY